MDQLPTFLVLRYWRGSTGKIAASPIAPPIAPLSVAEPRGRMLFCCPPSGRTAESESNTKSP
jgi:hypothetical protein